MLLSSSTELPQTTGAPLFVSVRQIQNTKSAFGLDQKEDAPFNKAIPVCCSVVRSKVFKLKF